MERRAFLGTLLATLGALTVDPSHLLWRPTADGPVIVDGACVALDQIVQRLLFEVSRYIAGPLVDAHVLGESGLVGQASVSMTPPDTLERDGLDSERYIVPAAQALVLHLKHKRARQFSAPPIPQGMDIQAAVIRSPETGMAVRGLRMVYLDPVEYDWRDVLRFDVLYAT